MDTLSRRTYFWDTAVPCGSENSHNVVQLNPDEDKYYLLNPYPTLMQSRKKFSPESIRAFARNPNIDLQSIGIYSKSDIQHHIRTQQFKVYCGNEGKVIAKNSFVLVCLGWLIYSPH